MSSPTTIDLAGHPTERPGPLVGRDVGRRVQRCRSDLALPGDREGVVVVQRDGRQHAAARRLPRVGVADRGPVDQRQTERRRLADRDADQEWLAHVTTSAVVMGDDPHRVRAPIRISTSTTVDAQVRAADVDRFGAEAGRLADGAGGVPHPGDQLVEPDDLRPVGAVVDDRRPGTWRRRRARPSPRRCRSTRTAARSTRTGRPAAAAGTATPGRWRTRRAGPPRPGTARRTRWRAPCAARRGRRRAGSRHPPAFLVERTAAPAPRPAGHRRCGTRPRPATRRRAHRTGRPWPGTARSSPGRRRPPSSGRSPSARAWSTSTSIEPARDLGGVVHAGRVRVGGAEPQHLERPTDDPVDIPQVRGRERDIASYASVHSQIASGSVTADFSRASARITRMLEMNSEAWLSDRNTLVTPRSNRVAPAAKSPTYTVPAVIAAAGTGGEPPERSARCPG